MRLACDWITDIAQCREEGLPPCARAEKMAHKTWKGSIKGEYRAAKKEWDFFCAIWHTGQAVKALCEAYRLFGDAKYLEGAKLGADFICRERISDQNDPDYGLIFAVENSPDSVNTSAILEGLDGLLTLYDLTGDGHLKKVVLDAVAWAAQKAYMGGGLFRDDYMLGDRAFRAPSWMDLFTPADGAIKPKGRPLLDDAIFLKAWNVSGNARYKEIFYETANRLLQDEMPAGNWMNYPPCGGINRNIHPRHAFWWGAPMLDAWRDCGEQKYLDCFIRSCTWYANAQRADGGLFRNTYDDYKTDSFGHATSGMACAILMWNDAYKLTGDKKWADHIRLGMDFCMNMQFIDVIDGNLKGAVCEKVLMPKGTDLSPYHIRDLGTIFFVQAAAAVLPR